MDTNKRVPNGSIHVHAVIKFKQAGDFAKFKDKFQAMVAACHKEDGMISGEAFLKERDTPENATQAYSITLWKNKEALEEHMKFPHTKDIYDFFKEIGATVERLILCPAFGTD